MPPILEWLATMPSAERFRDLSVLRSQPLKYSFTHLVERKRWWEQILSLLESRPYRGHFFWIWPHRSALWARSLLSNTAARKFPRVGPSTKTDIRRLILKPLSTDLSIPPEDRKVMDLESRSRCWQAYWRG